ATRQGSRECEDRDGCSWISPSEFHPRRPPDERATLARRDRHDPTQCQVLHHSEVRDTPSLRNRFSTSPMEHSGSTVALRQWCMTAPGHEPRRGATSHLRTQTFSPGSSTRVLVATLTAAFRARSGLFSEKDYSASRRSLHAAQLGR